MDFPHNKISGVYILENTARGGKNIIKTTLVPTKKGLKERKDKGKEKKSEKMTEQEQCFLKLWETWEKCRK